jgi:flagellar hook-length control protein FliK
MPIAVNPTIPLVSTGEAVGGTAMAGVVQLQPGTVVNAEVLDILSENVARIAIANLALDVLTEVPLAVGQQLQLAVSQTQSGLRLAVVTSASGASDTGASVATESAPNVPTAPISDTVILAPNAPNAPVGPPANIAVNAAQPADPLSPAERIAVTTALETAAAQQSSQAPLFANLAAAFSANHLPPPLRAAIAQVLALQTPLSQDLGGEDIKTAIQKSGLFFEASLASGAIPSSGNVPDLKAALIVLRHVLVSSIQADGIAEDTLSLPLLSQSAPPIVSREASPAPQALVSLPASLGEATLAPADPEMDTQRVLFASAPALPERIVETNNSIRIELAEPIFETVQRAAVTRATLNLLQELAPESAEPADPALARVTLPNGRTEQAIVRTNTPPPPFRGARPSAQPIALPSVATNAPLATTAHHLLENTDAAIARQTLLQIASLPDRPDGSAHRTDSVGPQWNFEIPFATAQGTAMAQFEISRDGDGGGETEPAKRIWRARFSLNVEPAGPVHALISLVGEKTSVRIWAERPATAAQLRAGAGELSHALSRAELKPGDIVVKSGAPPQPPPPPAGHFLDRAL